MLILDTISEFHRFVNSEVKINSKRSFEGRGVYEYVNFNLDTFNIPFSEFEIKESIDGTKTSSSRGDVAESKPILMEPGFNFYGSIELLGNSEQLFSMAVFCHLKLKIFKNQMLFPLMIISYQVMNWH